MQESNPNGPAEELRSAATLLRETAAPATELRPGPWATRPRGNSGITSRVETATGGRLVAETFHWAEDRLAAWIALASPALAEPLAAWLEDEAEHFAKEFIRDQPECPSCGDGACNHPEQDYHDGSDDRAGCERPFGGPEDNRCACFDHALAVARTILGTAQHGSEAGR